MAAQITAVTDSWRDGQSLDVLAEMQAITGATVVATMFSEALPPVLFRNAIEDVRTLVGGVYVRMLLPKPLDRLPTPGNRRYHRACTRLRRTLEGALVDRRSDDGSTLLSTLTHGNGSTLSDADITDQVTNFFIAGFETSAGLLAWALSLLAEHPGIQRRLHAEVDTVLDGGAAAFEHLPRLNLTGRIVSETLRLRPPAWIATRVTAADTHLGGHHVPAGTTIVYSPYVLHHRPDVFPAPEGFDPDRWESPDLSPQHGYAFIPFGGGPRKCIGDKFAVNEAVLALATIAARWRLEPVAGHRARPDLGVTLRPRGLRLRVTARGRDE
jgi:pentalenene oxygenase